MSGSEMHLLTCREHPQEWRVEDAHPDGTFDVVTFTGPNAETLAMDYYMAKLEASEAQLRAAREQPGPLITSEGVVGTAIEKLAETRAELADATAERGKLRAALVQVTNIASRIAAGMESESGCDFNRAVMDLLAALACLDDARKD